MRRSEFDHAIRAAGSILGEKEVLIIGSQAIHGSISSRLPEEAGRSVEVDVAVFGDTHARKADLIDGAIGEASMFHETFGYYAEGVTETTATLPDGWRDRLVRYETPATNGVVAWCLELHDLWLAKAVAGRPKDYEYCRALAREGFVNSDTLEERLRLMADLSDPVRDAAAPLIASTSQGR